MTDTRVRSGGPFFVSITVMMVRLDANSLLTSDAQMRRCVVVLLLRVERLLRHLICSAAIFLFALVPAQAQDTANPELVGELMAFHGTKAIVSAMTTHCYETTGLDSAYHRANDDWYLRNIGFLDLANRVAERLGGGTPAEVAAAETYGGTQIMSAYNQAKDKDSFCQGFLDQVNSGALDIDESLPGALKKAQDIASQ